MSDRRVIRKLERDAADRRALASCTVDPALLADDRFDYSKVVVRKPWGYEYLIFQNDAVAVWILFIQAGASTSMHCHLGKTTALTVLNGAARCATLDRESVCRSGQGCQFGPGVFHRTAAISSDGIYVMEIECPVNKRDLVRYQDAYGREGKGYETAEHMTVNLSNYNYISFITSSIYYNVRKRFGDSTIRLVRANRPGSLGELLGPATPDLLGVLRGTARRRHHDAQAAPGDIIDCAEWMAESELSVDAGFEAVVVSTTDRTVRAADLLISHLKARRVTAFYFVPGTSNAHLVDAVARDTELNFIPQTADHAAAFAAVTYAKVKNETACCLLSAGSAATHALTAVADAWADSAPVLFLSAQSRLTSLGPPDRAGLRQLANKEVAITEIARPITKYAAGLTDPRRLREELDRALFLANEGRKGPVWLDVPIDLLGTTVDEMQQTEFAPPRPGVAGGAAQLSAQIRRAGEMLRTARRPVLLAGHGIRAAGAEDDFARLVERLDIPVLTTRRGADLLPDDDPRYFGRPGTYGQRAANFIIQNCDLLLCLGARLSLPLVGRNYRTFARAAKKIVVDVDPAELTKPTIRPDLAIAADVGNFMRALLQEPDLPTPDAGGAWQARCRRWTHDFPPGSEAPPGGTEGVNPYGAVETLSRLLGPDALLIAEGGPCVDYLMQSFRFKRGQRMVSSSGLEADCFALPGASGAFLATAGKRRIVCLCEAPGFLLSLPEISTIVAHRLPVTILVFCCPADVQIRQMQSSYFGGRRVERASQHDIARQAMEMFRFLHETPTFSMRQDEEVAPTLERLLAEKAPALGSLYLPADQQMVPRMALTVQPDGTWTSPPLEDMYPFLPRATLKANMLIESLEESAPAAGETPARC